jgi:hypothetical protein
MILPPLLHADLSLSPEMCISPEQAAHCHIHSLYVWDFISDRYATGYTITTLSFMRFEVLVVVTVEIIAFSHMTPYILMKIYETFGGRV